MAGQSPIALPGTNDLLWQGSLVSAPPRLDFAAFEAASQTWSAVTVSTSSFMWRGVGNSSGFGSAPAGCPVWVADFTGTGGDDILFYHHGDGHWFLGVFVGDTLAWRLVSDTTNGANRFGDLVAGGCLFWTGDFTGGGSD